MPGEQIQASQSTQGSSGAVNNAALIVPSLPLAPLGTIPTPGTTFQQIHDLSSKRIATLEYLRKVHSGSIYWYNTLLFTRKDMLKMSSFEVKKLGRRATNHMLLGLSLPAILELNTANTQEYLRALIAVLTEYESYQQIHPPEGTSSSSLSRARIPHMFKRSGHPGGKPRRTSSAAEIGLPMGSSDSADAKTGSSAGSGAVPLTSTSLPVGDQDLMPGEEYQYLQTPSLPFEPDYFETFASLCDVLIDCYSRVMELISSPSSITTGVSESFAKADAKLRKVMIAGTIKEFEDAGRSGAKHEFAALGKVVMGGLA